jgi:hypothetical protein
MSTSEELTYNNFKSTTVRGNFTNADSPDGTILADGYFNRNLNVKGDLILGDFVADTGGNIQVKVNGNVETITSFALLSAVNPQTILIDDFLIYFDQFTPNSQYAWAFIE